MLLLAFWALFFGTSIVFYSSNHSSMASLAACYWGVLGVYNPLFCSVKLDISVQFKRFLLLILISKRHIMDKHSQSYCGLQDWKCGPLRCQAFTLTIRPWCLSAKKVVLIRLYLIQLHKSLKHLNREIFLWYDCFNLA